MTPFNSTPVIWIAFSNTAEAKSLAERIDHFEDATVLDVEAIDPAALMKDVGQHQTGWLLVDEVCFNDEGLQELARNAGLKHEFFRCMVIGTQSGQKWPDETIYLESDTLSTTIIDRLRNESHVLRIASSRMRHVRRLQNR